MKLSIVILTAILLARIFADPLQFSNIPENQLKALEQSLKFERAKVGSQPNAKGILQNLFGGNKLKQNAFSFSKNLNEENSVEESNPQKEQPEKNLLNQFQKSADFAKLMKNLPYQALLPKRKNSPLDIVSKMLTKNQDLQQDDDSQSEDNPMLDRLNELIEGKNKKQKNKVFWQNPNYKNGAHTASYSKIFGQKRKVRGNHVRQEDIKNILVKTIPSFKDGEIIKLSQVSYSRGTYLHIEYQTVKKQLYMIKAKYMPKDNQLEIMSLNEINPSWRKNKIQLQKEQVKIQKVSQIQKIKNNQSKSQQIKIENNKTEQKVEQVKEVKEAQKSKEVNENKQSKILETPQIKKKQIETKQKQDEVKKQQSHKKNQLQRSKENIPVQIVKKTDTDLLNQNKLVSQSKKQQQLSGKKQGESIKEQQNDQQASSQDSSNDSDSSESKESENLNQKSEKLIESN